VLLPPTAARRQQPRLRAYAQERAQRMALGWSTEPVEAPARTQAEFDAYAERWAAEVTRYGLRTVNFVSAGGNERRAELVRAYPGKFTGFAHHRLEPGAETEL